MTVSLALRRRGVGIRLRASRSWLTLVIDQRTYEQRNVNVRMYLAQDREMGLRTLPSFRRLTTFLSVGSQSIAE